MFKLESYVTPLLMGYIDQYVALKQEDFQLSLWGGDAVLNKLDLRLDVIEKAIQLPVTFKSGHIHELRLHVPWTALGSEPVIVTINTIECVMRLRDSAHVPDSESQTSEQSVPKAKRKQRQPVEPDLPPGYIQGLINRILNNINIVVNNLILKFVEDDIVLSVNVKSAECYSVNSNWMRDFVDLAVPDLALRRVIDFSDLTICLDKRNASGKIETYQDPLLYRCPVTCRIHSQYDGLYSKYPSTTKINFLCEKLDLSLTDTQVPMFFRLLELCIAIYYGTLRLPEPSGSEPSEASFPSAPSPLESSVDPPSSDAEFIENDPDYNPEDQEGWVSWAWSYVPQILPTEDDYEFEDEASARARRKNEPGVLVIGFCIDRGSLTFKLTETIVQEDYFGPTKVNFKPNMVWRVEGVSMQTVIRGLDFFDVQFGVTSTKIECLGQAICGTKDTDDPYRNPVFFSSSSPDTDPSLKVVNYATESLFDPGGAESAGEKAEFIFDPERHQQTYTETYGLKKYGAFWMDYLYTMEKSDNRPGSSRSSASGASEDSTTDHRENSCMRFLIGPAHLCVSSSMVQRLHKFIHCAMDHEYEPYSDPPSDEVEELRIHPTEEEVAQLEEFVATRSQHFTFLQPRITIQAADLDEYDVKKTFKSTASHRKHRKKKEAEPVVISRPHTLPCLLLQADRMDIQVTAAMYPRHLVKTISTLSAPPAGLLHHCHSHTYFKVFGLSGGLSALDPTTGFLPPQTLLQPVNTVYYFKRLLLPQYWKNPLQPKTVSAVEIPQFAINATFPQIFLAIHIGQTWTQKSPNPAQLDDISLLQDTFRPVKPSPVLRFVLSGFELKRCQTDAALSFSATLSSMQLVILHSDDGNDVMTPLMYGPLNTADIHSLDFFTRSDGASSTECLQDFFNATVQIPANSLMPQAHAAVFLNIQGVCACFDPVLVRWLKYKPIVLIHPRSSVSPIKETKAMKSSEDGRSDSTVTMPTGSQTQSHSQTYNHTRTSSKVKEEAVVAVAEPKEDQSWGEVLSKIYPLVKIVQVQVDISSWCFFLPLKPLKLSRPSVNIASSIHHEYLLNGLPPTVVICCPRVRVCSAGHKPISPVQDIPIRSLEHSVAGEKLPWTVKLSNASMYTITENQLQETVKPMGVSATLAVTTKYHPPTSDNITALGLCIHADMDPSAVYCSKPQMTLIVNLLSGYLKLAYEVAKSIQTLMPPQASETPAQQPVPSSNTPPSFKTPPNTDPALLSITETSDTFSISPPSPENELSDHVKLSLWIQWTLPKFTFKLYTKDANKKDICIQNELEDLSAAIDIHSVYMKIKCKAGSFNIIHQTRQKDDQWTAGSFHGILISCYDQLARPLHLVANKTRQPKTSAMPNLFHTEEQKPRDHGFLNLTFTRAQRKNVKQKLKKTSIEGMLDLEKGGGVTFSDDGTVYLNEICINIEPCDVIMNGPVLASVLDVFTIAPSSNPSPKSEPSPIPLVTSSALPLIYMSAANFRIFLPTCHSQKGHDLCVLQINAINLQPHADNPLSRVVKDKEIYRQASHAGILRHPGSQVEDRQYQLDICSLSIATGSWNEVISRENQPLSLSMEPLVQNPALEWNMQKQTCEETPDLKQLIPMAAPFDLKIVVAPAVVFIPKDGIDKASLVCGHSLELNATSDMDFLLSVKQMQLMSSILSSNIFPLMSSMTPRRSSSAKKILKCEEAYQDSGVESEASTTIAKSASSSAAAMNMTPFHVFLTAGRISCTLYGHQPLKGVLTTDNKVFPYMFLSISQPHTWVSCNSDTEQKCELSCFDVALRGAKLDHSFEEEGKWIPDPMDFSVPWIETRPGKPQKATGIPPSLYTIRIIDFLCPAASLEILLERPLKFNISCRKFEESLAMVNVFSKELSFSQPPAKSTGPPPPASDSVQSLAFFKSLRLSTVQIVVAMETMPDPMSPKMSISVSSLQSDVQVHTLPSGCISSIEGSLFINDFLLKTSYDSKWLSLLGPTSPAVHAQATWSSSSGPVFLVYCDCSIVHIQFGQDNMLCLHLLSKHLTEFFNKLSPAASPPRELECKSKPTALRLTDPTEDDLRAGSFTFIDEKVSMDELPLKNQILFGYDYDTGCAAMSWCYAEPRVLTKVSVTPVPFTIQRPMEAEMVDETFKVPCTLQYYNLLTRSFENYAELMLSENDPDDLHLPEVTGHDPYSRVSASQLWRVLIHKVDDEDEDDREEDDKSSEQWLEPIVSPLTLAASIHVNSSYVPALVPVLQCAVNVGCWQLSLQNHFSHLGKTTPSKLYPFEIGDTLVDHEWMQLNLNSFTLNASLLLPLNAPKISAQANTIIEASVIEYHNLKKLPLLTTTNLSSSIAYSSKEQVENMKVDLHLDSLSLQIGQAAVHTLNSAMLAWNLLGSTGACRVVPHQYIICNDTQEAIRFRQGNSEGGSPVLTVLSREALPYAWRSSCSLEMEFSVESIPDQWTPALSIDLPGTNVCSVGKGCSNSTLIVRVRPITNCQMQIIITGGMTVASRLSQLLDVRISANRAMKEAKTQLPPGGTLPSYICGADDVRALRVRLHGQNNPWSTEITCDRDRDSKLIKLSTSDKSVVIHVWCHSFLQKHQDLNTMQTDKQHMVLFTPLFIVRNQLPAPLLMNINTPRLKSFTQLELEGRGLEKQLHMIGGGDLVHNITYQLSPQMKPSSPPVSLSSGLIEQMNTAGLEHFDVDAMSYEWANYVEEQWPYNQTDCDSPLYPPHRKPILQDIIVPQSSTPYTPSNSPSSHFPDIDLQIQLSQKWAGCNTILIDIVPYMLIVNQTPLDLKLIDVVAEDDWTLPSMKTFAPPVFKGCVCIGMVSSDLVHSSEAITFSQEDNESRYLPSLPNVLYINGHINVSIPIQRDGSSTKICHLAVHSTRKKDIRVITITERFSINNWSLYDFHILSYNLCHPNKVQLIHNDNDAVLVPLSKTDDDQCMPLLFWETANDNNCMPSSSYVHYISMKECSISQWSYPARLAISNVGNRQTIAVTSAEGSKSITLTCQEKQCRVYLSLCEDKEPPVQLHNNCSFPLYFGQSFTSSDLETDATVQEEKELLLTLPVISPYSSTFYSFPEIDARFPEIQNTSSVTLKLHLGGYCIEKDDISWSSAFEVSTEHAIFTHIAGISDLKVQISKEGNTTHVYVEPVTRAEVSAKEIRSRLRGGKESVRVEKVPVTTATTESDSVQKPKEEKKTCNERYIDLNILCTQVTLILLDNVYHDYTTISEMLCLTADNVGFSCYPKLDIARSTSAKPKYDQTVALCIGNIQVDNQLFGERNYDFPVLVTSQQQSLYDEQFPSFSLEEKLGIVMNHGVVCLTLGFYNDTKQNAYTIQTAKLVIKPLEIHAEDIFIYDLLKEIDQLIPTRILDESVMMHNSVPLAIKSNALSLHHPVRMDNICIEPIEMLVSVHACLKVFLASDNTPLKFGRYEKSLFTSHQQLMKSLITHYVSGALVRAGHVVGSLEILGNPTGLVRHISQGVSDLFRMPYQGFTRGPGAFIRGVTHGMGSLVKHVSTGTLNSITNFASSVSRNMERLSLDSEHAERQEEARRHKPSGVSQGLANGLSGFGISLLGAVAGIADQPLRSLTQPAPSKARAATGLVSGVGKGLMGVVTKPIGGAAELVSQTGMGLLQGTGLAKYPSARHKPCWVTLTDLEPSLFNLSLLQLPSFSQSGFFVLPARFSPPSHSEDIKVFLLLTSDVMIVVDEHEVQRQVYALNEVTCHVSSADPTLLLISPKAQHSDEGSKHNQNEDLSNKDRIAQFIGLGQESLGQVNTERASRNIQHKFHVDAIHKDLFIALFHQAQLKLRGYGFVL